MPMKFLRAAAPAFCLAALCAAPAIAQDETPPASMITGGGDQAAPAAAAAPVPAGPA